MITQRIFAARLLPAALLLAALTVLACVAPPPEPLPTYTPYPTYTPVTVSSSGLIPTLTIPLSQKWNIHADRIFGVRDAHLSISAQDGEQAIIVGCYTGLNDWRLGERWYTFSKDGRFNKARVFVAVSGLSMQPTEGGCYEMLVEREGSKSFCYYETSGPVPPLVEFGFGCSGWTQLTQEFYLVDTSAIGLIPRDEWRRNYQDYQ